MDYYDLGSYTRKVTTAVPDAQLWFDRGLNWLYGFNHAEAIASFNKVLDETPGIARGLLVTLSRRVREAEQALTR